MSCCLVLRAQQLPVISATTAVTITTTITHIRRISVTNDFIEVGMLSHVQLFVTPQTIVRQAPLFMGSSWHKFWSGLPFPLPGELSGPGIETVSPAS